jgi:uncharacterized membrane protein YfcA
VTALGYGLAVVIGISLGLLGGGGSILTVPVLVYVMGLPVKTAVPMSLFVVGTTSLVGAVSHQRRRHVRWDAALTFGPPAIVGAFAGARIAAAVSSTFQLVLFAVLMIAAAMPMYFGPLHQAAKRPAALESTADADGVTPGRLAPRPLMLMAALGLGVGVITGLVGIGGGFLYVPALVLIGRLVMTQAVGTSLVLIVLSSAAGLAGHAGSASIPWSVAAIFTGLAMAGVLTGSRLAARVPQSTLRRGFAVLLVIMGVLVLLEPRP